MRSFKLAGTSPIARPRMLALRIVELVSASWAELEMDGVERPARALPRPALHWSAPARAWVAGAGIAQDAHRSISSRSAPFAHGAPTASPAAGVRAAAPWLRATRNLSHLARRLHHGARGEGRWSREDLGRHLRALGARSRRAHGVGDWLFRAGAGLRGGGGDRCGSPADPARLEGRCAWAPSVGPLVQLDASRRLVRGLAAGVSQVGTLKPRGRARR